MKNNTFFILRSHISRIIQFANRESLEYKTENQIILGFPKSKPIKDDLVIIKFEKPFTYKCGGLFRIVISRRAVKLGEEVAVVYTTPGMNLHRQMTRIISQTHCNNILDFKDYKHQFFCIFLDIDTNNLEKKFGTLVLQNGKLF